MGVVLGGAGLVWRRQRVLWWLYGVNLLLGLAGTVLFTAGVGAVLDHSLAAGRLAGGFDVLILLELLQKPEAALGPPAVGSFFFSLIFFVFMLFLTGGILDTYRRDTPLTTAEFFESCGGFFWRFVRLLLFLLIVLVPVGIAFGLLHRYTGRVAGDAPREMLGFWVELAGTALLLLLLMAVRLWFDMAQVRAVAEGERAMRRTLWRALKLTAGNFGSLFWLYLRISLVAWAALGLAGWVWIKFVPPTATGASFLLGQGVALLWLATRLWQRASETLWYERRRPAPLPVSPPLATPFS